MFRLIPPALHRGLFRLAHVLRRCWWRIRKPRLHGCRVLAFDAQGRVLLVRHSYGSGKWMPPGGGIGRSESPITAALRELREETGCALQDAMEIAEVEERLHGAGNRVHVIAGGTRDAPCPDGREIIEARFFAPDALPAEMPAHLAADLPEWIRAAKAVRR
ncbi:MAG TPA: NUDIX domain-containing protein [Novosphingobium sp.]